jgi:endonuclease-3 related protein
MDRSSADAQATRRALLAVHDRLLAAYGPQRWWPGDTPFEVMVGSILTQNTAWSNVEKAIANLKSASPGHRDCAAEEPQPEYEVQGILDPEAILAVSTDELAQCIRPAGYFNVKARRLRSFCVWYVEHGGYRGLAHWDTAALRQALLKVSGVGPETADDILLYAFRRPVFVIDVYTRRLFSRLGLAVGGEDYETLRALFESNLPSEAPLFNEYHALIVRHAKHVCRKQPRCGECCLADACEFALMGRPASGAAA